MEGRKASPAGTSVGGRRFFPLELTSLPGKAAIGYSVPVFQNKTTTNVNCVSGEQLSKEVFISLDGLKPAARGLTVKTQKIHLNKVSNIEFYGVLWSS